MTEIKRKQAQKNIRIIIIIIMIKNYLQRNTTLHHIETAYGRFNLKVLNELQSEHRTHITHTQSGPNIKCFLTYQHLIFVTLFYNLLLQFNNLHEYYLSLLRIALCVTLPDNERLARNTQEF
jgi:hypothetical protein